MTRFPMPALVVALAVSAGAAAARADEVKVPLDQLPKPVAEALKKRFPKAELIEASKETDNGKTEYEVEIKHDGAKMDVTLTPEGVLIEIEKEIATKDLPKAVSGALAKKYPKGTIKSADAVTKFKDGKELPVQYEVVVATDKKTVEVELAADGKILAAEEKKD